MLSKRVVKQMAFHNTLNNRYDGVEIPEAPMLPGISGDSELKSAHRRGVKEALDFTIIIGGAVKRYPLSRQQRKQVG